MRQPDETTCFTCGSTIKRDVRLCPQCGATIAAGPAMAGPAMAGPAVAGSVMQAGSYASSAVQPAYGRSGAQDVVGAGRYVLNFLLAGFIGLILTYLLRNHGWLATWICIPVMIFVVIVLASAGPP